MATNVLVGRLTLLASLEVRPVRRSEQFFPNNQNTPPITREKEGERAATHLVIKSQLASPHSASACCLPPHLLPRCSECVLACSRVASVAQRPEPSNQSVDRFARCFGPFGGAIALLTGGDPLLAWSVCRCLGGERQDFQMEVRLARSRCPGECADA